MMGFERFNLRRKNQVHNRQCPEKTLVSAYKHDAAARFRTFDKAPAAPLPVVCSLSGTVTQYSPEPDIVAELIAQGVGRGETVLHIRTGSHTNLSLSPHSHSLFHPPTPLLCYRMARASECSRDWTTIYGRRTINGRETQPLVD